jgi:hypothetical protein
MAWAASSKSASKKAGIPQNVAREFVAADARKDRRMDIAKHLTRSK